MYGRRNPVARSCGAGRYTQKDALSNGALSMKWHMPGLAWTAGGSRDHHHQHGTGGKI